MIYCVEDDASIRDIEVYALRSTGFEAEGVESGPALFAALKRVPAELIILDVMLPGEDGLDILKSSASAPPRGTSPSSWRRRAARNTTR